MLPSSCSFLIPPLGGRGKDGHTGRAEADSASATVTSSLLAGKMAATANKLIENSPERTIKKLFTNNPDGENVAVVETPSDSSQANYILETVKELLKKYPLQDIAILCRRRSTAEPIVKAFRKQAIRFNFVGETGFFQEPIIKDVTAYLKVISNPLENNAEIVRILNRNNYGIKQIEICKFNCYADKK